MHPPSSDKPTQGQLIYPLLRTLQAQGGSGRSVEIANALADTVQLPDSVRNAVAERNDGRIENLWHKHVRFAKQKAVALGYVASERSHGNWQLTDAGFEGLSKARPAILVDVLREADGTPRAVRINVAISVPTTHLLVHGDARRMDWIPTDSIPLICTSIPYFDLKRYGDSAWQLATINSFDAFLASMEDVLRECYRILMPGGRAAINVGDVLRSRAKHGSHHLLPLSAEILTRSTRMGFHMLNGIIWAKEGNCTSESGDSSVLGQPGQPNGIIKLATEQILMLRKPGPYRKPTPHQIRDSAIAPADYQRWFSAIWTDIPGESTKGDHPAPFPVRLAERIVRMYSFVNDTIVDPFGGSGTTSVAAAHAARNSIYVDAERHYVRVAARRLLSANAA